MTERRYGFRFNIVEAGVLAVGVVFSSVLIFLSGVYVGKGVEAHRTVEQRDALRIPITLTTDPPASGATTPLAWKLPKDKPTESQPSNPAVDAEGERLSTNPAPQPLNAPDKAPARKSPAASTLSRERREASEEKERPTTEEPLSVAAKEKPRPRKEAPPAKIEERSAASVREKPRVVKESAPVKVVERLTAATKESSRPVEREKARANSQEGREPPVRTAAVQTRPTEKLLDPPPPPSVPAQRPTGGAKKWKVQVEATSREETAREIADSLRAQGYAPTVSKVQKEGAVLYRVRVGRFATQEEAVAAIGRFRRDGKFSQAYPVSE